MCDAHEEPRNPHDKNHNFYDRAVFTYKNWHRYSNPTVCNLMFETQSPLWAYDRLNSLITQRTAFFYLASVSLNTLTCMAATFFLRYRRVNLLGTLVAGTGYYCLFNLTNNILY